MLCLEYLVDVFLFLYYWLSYYLPVVQKPQGKLLYDPREVAELSSKLGIGLSNIDKDDDRNMPLYAEVSQWLGVPYRYAGLSRRGLDCSGFAYLI